MTNKETEQAIYTLAKSSKMLAEYVKLLSDELRAVEQLLQIVTACIVALDPENTDRIRLIEERWTALREAIENSTAFEQQGGK